MKIMATRIQEFIENLIVDEQYACRNNSGVIDELKLIRNLVVKVEAEGVEGIALLTLDFERAFDTINHDYLWNVLRAMNFPAEFVGMMEKI